MKRFNPGTLGVLLAICCTTGAAWEEEIGPKIQHQVRNKNVPGGPTKSPDGKFRVKVDGSSVHLHDEKTGKRVSVLHHPDHPQRRGKMEVSHWAFSPDSKLIAVGVGDIKHRDPSDTVGYVYIWEVAQGKFVKGYGHKSASIGWVTELKFQDNNTLLIYSRELSGK